MGIVCCIRCITIWVMTLAICFFNTFFCAGLSAAVTRTSGIGYAFMVIFVLLNLGLVIVSVCTNNDDYLTFNCFLSCSSVIVLMTISFTLITRYHYYERLPYHPEERHGASVLTVHKMGLILLVSGIPVIYGCKCRHLLKDKKLIYKVIGDFIDIYDMADVLALGAASCTPLDSSKTINGGLYKKTRLKCIDSTVTALKEENSMEIAVQVLCSLSFLIFLKFCIEAWKNLEDESTSKYITIPRLLQDISFFVMRTLVWILYGFENQFIFMAKNVISASLTSLELFSFSFSKVKNSRSSNASRQNPNQNQISHTNPGFDSNH